MTNEEMIMAIYNRAKTELDRGLLVHGMAINAAELDIITEDEFHEYLMKYHANRRKTTDQA